LAAARSDIGEARKPVGWNHIRLSVVVPIGVIVAVAIVCVVVAVLSSAQRADEVALDTERQLFTRALANHGERVLREIESVSTSEVANRRIRVEFDPAMDFAVREAEVREAARRGFLLLEFLGMHEEHKPGPRGHRPKRRAPAKCLRPETTVTSLTRHLTVMNPKAARREENRMNPG